VAKAGIVCSLNARSSILASANPKDSAYDPKMSIVENINLPKNLMTRFDFIWLMLDKRQKDNDRRLAGHLISMYTEAGARNRVEPSIDSELFRRYVSFAKRWVFPKLTDESESALIKGYIDLRNQGTSREAITATPRILETLIRTSESLAKMELREEVLTTDVEEAIRLLKAATYAAAIDPETGLIDMEQLIVGMGAARRKRNKELEQLVQDIVGEAGDRQLGQEQLKVALNEKLGERKEQLASDAELRSVLTSLEQQGAIRRQGKMIEGRAS
jgi:DNA replication licensing factor MCM4